MRNSASVAFLYEVHHAVKRRKRCIRHPCHTPPTRKYPRIRSLREECSGAFLCFGAEYERGVLIIAREPELPAALGNRPVVQAGTLAVHMEEHPEPIDQAVVGCIREDAVLRMSSSAASRADTTLQECVGST